MENKHGIKVGDKAFVKTGHDTWNLYTVNQDNIHEINENPEDYKPAAQCPECMGHVEQEELDMFGGLCETCNEE